MDNETKKKKKHTRICKVCKINKLENGSWFCEKCSEEASARNKKNAEISLKYILSRKR
jgi:ribosomal protein L37AE/L43A